MSQQRSNGCAPKKWPSRFLQLIYTGSYQDKDLLHIKSTQFSWPCKGKRDSSIGMSYTAPKVEIIYRSTVWRKIRHRFFYDWVWHLENCKMLLRSTLILGQDMSKTEVKCGSVCAQATLTSIQIQIYLGKDLLHIKSGKSGKTHGS